MVILAQIQKHSVKSSTKILTILGLLSLLHAYPSLGQKNQEPEIDTFISNLFHITEVMVTDVASPPAAARFYAYSTLAAHLGWLHATNQAQQNSLLNQSNFNAAIIPLHVNININPHFVSTYAMLEVGNKIMPSGYLLKQKQEILVKEFLKKKFIKSKTLQENLSFAVKIAEEVLKIAASDDYNKLSTLTRYTPKKEEGHWYPTPPAYMSAVDPDWKTIKPFFIEDIKLFKPKPPAAFSNELNSPFQLQMQEVLEVTGNLTEEMTLIANFWDCNPFKVNYSGHMAIGIKKISPGGHWIGITGIACEKATLTWEQAIQIHTLVAMGLHDAFISCWEEKYDSDRIRPEAAINKMLDPSWRPLLQTPPFPEYTSGHSVISRVSAVILTDFFGEDFGFVDTSEVYFGLPERSFQSFLKAADEAAISRLYGGIHFRDAIEEGVKQGDKIGKYILSRVHQAPELTNAHHSVKTH